MFARVGYILFARLDIL